MTNYYRERDEDENGIFIQQLADEFEGLLETYIDELDPSEIVDGLTAVIARMSRVSGKELLTRAIDYLEEVDKLS